MTLATNWPWRSCTRATESARPEAAAGLVLSKCSHWSARGGRCSQIAWFRLAT
ncbi:MAG: hypothetical protein U1F50_17400 [Rubrivivax sp.]